MIDAVSRKSPDGRQKKCQTFVLFTVNWCIHINAYDHNFLIIILRQRQDWRSFYFSSTTYDIDRRYEARSDRAIY